MKIAITTIVKKYRLNIFHFLFGVVVMRYKITAIGIVNKIIYPMFVIVWNILTENTISSNIISDTKKNKFYLFLYYLYHL